MVTVDPISEIERSFYAENGYLVVRGLFNANECDFWCQYFTDMVERGGDGWAEGGVDPSHEDPLKRYPRLLQPHRGDKVAFDYMVDARINRYLTSFYDREPLAVQTMVYFKPPGARGQALHQDNRYLQAEPGTCMAAWLALEDIDDENGCKTLATPGASATPATTDVAQTLTRVMVLHAVAYCERLFYLEEVEEIRVADERVLAGRILHETLPDDQPVGCEL